MALLQGLTILADYDLNKVAIFGDSRHVIYKMLNGYTTGSIKCHWLYDKITPLLSTHYEFYHILRSNNVATDDLANVGASLPQGHFQLNGLDTPPSLYPNELWFKGFNPLCIDHGAMVICEDSNA